MAKFFKNPTLVDAISFGDLVEYGKSTGCPIIEGLPWSFEYEGQCVTHESNDCYIVDTHKGNQHMTRNDILINSDGCLWIENCETFFGNYTHISLDMGLE